MALSHFRMLIHELLNKDPEIVTEEVTLIILDSKSIMFMDENGKDTKHTRHIEKRIHLVRNGEKCKMKNIDCCEGCLPTADLPHSNQYFASCIFLHSLLNVFSFQCVWCVWYPYHSHP